MSDVGQWLRSAPAAALVSPAVTGTALAGVLLADVAAPPRVYQLVLLTLAAGLVGFAAWSQRRLTAAGVQPGSGPVGSGQAAERATPGGPAGSAGPDGREGSAGPDGPASTVGAGAGTGAGRAPAVEGRWARRLQTTAPAAAGRSGAAHPSRTAGGADPAAGRARPGLPAAPAARTARARRNRRTILIAVAAVLAVALWLPLGAFGRVAVAFATFFLGYVAYALPLLPLTALDVLPPVRRAAFPWSLVGKRRYTVGAKRRFVLADQLAIARGARDAAREELTGRPLGVLVAVLGLLHLLRDAPGFGDTGYPRAGGLLGMAVGAPLGWLLSPAGAIALLFGLLATAAVQTAELLRPYRGPRWAVAGLAALLVVPLAGVTAGRLAGYDYYLGQQRGRVVVLAGVSRHERHPVADTGVPVAQLPSSLRALLADGIPVAGADDGVRVAKALAHPRPAAAFPADGGDLAVGDCFTTAGPGDQLRYLAPCSAAHAGEVYFVGTLPLRHDPGARVAEAVGRAMCEAPYGAYLGVPYGQSYLPIEAPLARGPGWRPLGTVACWLRAVGPSPLRGTKTVAAMAPGLRWDTGANCTVSAGDSVTLTAARTRTRCVTPGRGHPEGASAGTLRIDASLMPVNDYAGGARTGIACLDGADAYSGYYAAVSPDGGLDLWKQAGPQRSGLASAKPKRADPVTADAFFDLRLSCVMLPEHAGVELTASTGTLTVHASDRTSPVLHLSPRLFVESNDRPSQAVTVAELVATLG
jgi:hypothetical protein